MERILSAQESWLSPETVYQGSLNSVMCYCQLRLAHDTPATARGLMMVVFKAAFTKSEAQTEKGSFD